VSHLALLGDLLLDHLAGHVGLQQVGGPDQIHSCLVTPRLVMNFFVPSTISPEANFSETASSDVSEESFLSLGYPEKDGLMRYWTPGFLHLHFPVYSSGFTP
jgi:hypothetical protein